MRRLVEDHEVGPQLQDRFDAGADRRDGARAIRQDGNPRIARQLAHADELSGAASRSAIWSRQRLTVTTRCGGCAHAGAIAVTSSMTARKRAGRPASKLAFHAEEGLEVRRLEAFGLLVYPIEHILGTSEELHVGTTS